MSRLGGASGAHTHGPWRSGELYAYLHRDHVCGVHGQIVWWFDGATLMLGNGRGRV